MIDHINTKNGFFEYLSNYSSVNFINYD
jgi:hypothetical protein